MQYELDLELFDAVNVEVRVIAGKCHPLGELCYMLMLLFFLQESKAAVAPRTICYLVKKAESNWWPRLLKKEGKAPVFLKVDWDKWQDEDDEDAGFGDFGDMDFSKLNMGGGDDDDDIEEEEEEEDDIDNVVYSANKEDEDAEAEGSKGEEAPATAAGDAKP
ncbi:unnamed protein product [Alopecurus aequalis]